MLIFYDAIAKAEIELPTDVSALPPNVNWIDAENPTEAEALFLKRLLGFDPPNRDRLSEIENSSRLYTVGDRLYLTTPMIYHDQRGVTRTTPLGFVLTKAYVLTIKFQPLAACDVRRFAAQIGDHAAPGGLGAFLAIMDEIVDHLADELERLTHDLDDFSHKIFGREDEGGKAKRNPAGRDLRHVLRDLGRAGSAAARIDESLLGLSRLTPYVAQGMGDAASQPARGKLKSLGRDISSLAEYEERLSEKTQFLLDASLGLISVDQNDIFKILTLVSVVGIPPTLVASMYGMNFKNMPELEWAYGYPYGLAMIVLSAFIPLAWFKWRGWW
jgi:magnesium transporter